MNEFWNRQRQLVPLFFILLLSTLTGLAQNFCDPAVQGQTGSFTVPPRVCVGQPLTISNVPASLINITYSYQYDGKGLPSNRVPITNNVYTSPGSYTILQVAAGGNATGTIACRVVEVLPNKPVDFSIKPCSNRLVSITIRLDNDTRRYNSITVRWDAGTPEQTVLPAAGATEVQLTHDYPAVATRRTIVVTGKYNDACSVPHSEIKDMPSSTVGNSAPIIRELRSSTSSITLDCQSDASFIVQQKDAGGTYQNKINVNDATRSFTIPATPNEVHCFRLESSDACAGPASRSAEVCSLAPVVQAEDRKNVVSWPAYAGSEAVTLYRGYKNGVSAPTWGGPVSPYEDNAGIVCGRIYCYEIEAKAGPTLIRSAPVCVTGLDNSTVASPTSAFVSVQPNGVSLQTTLPSLGLPNPYTLVVTRAEGTGTFTSLTTTEQTSYIDNTAQTGSQSYCYQVAVRNNCGVLSKPTNPACTILLTNTNGVLHWTPASPFSGGPPRSYQLNFVDPITGLSDTRPLGVVTSYQPDPGSAVTDYQIVAFDPVGIQSYSNPIQVELGMRVLLPNAFTPNSDGLNDSFMAKGQVSFWDTFSLTIFDRWGGVIFNSTDKNTPGWTGEVNGNPAASGYYGYRIRVTDQAGKAFERTGQVLLVR